MKKLKFTISRYTFATVFVFCALALQPVQAQIEFPDFEDEVEDEVPAAPIDGLLGLGLAAGAFYGAKKLKGKN